MNDLKPRKRLIKARRKLGMTQDDLAKKAKMSRPMLSHIERGYALPSLPVAYRISKIVGEPIEFIFFNSNARKSSEKTA